jgi:hypothetical protein
MLRIPFQRYLQARYEWTTRTNGAVLIPIQPVIRTNDLPFVLKCGRRWDLP